MSVSPPGHEENSGDDGNRTHPGCLQGSLAPLAHAPPFPAPFSGGSQNRSVLRTVAKRAFLCSVGPVGVEPTSNRVSDGCLAARSPARIESALYGSRTRLACSTGRSPHPLRHRAERVSGGSRTRLSTSARWCLGCSATDTQSKDGRSRTLCARVGAALLSQEHVLNKRKGQDSNLQGLAPRPLSKRVPSCLLARPSDGANESGRQDLNLRSRDSQPRDHSGLVHVLKSPRRESNPLSPHYKCGARPG